MHTLTPRLEHALRTHGLGDAELDELIRSGQIDGSGEHGATHVLRIDGDGGAALGAPADRVTLDGMPLTADSPDDLLERLRTFHAAPDRVAVTGTGATTDTEITMLEGATGARIPAGEHRRSGAMPAATEHAGGNWSAVSLAILVGAVVAVVSIAAYLLAR